MANDNNGSSDIFLRNRGTGTLKVISHRRGSGHVGNGASFNASISGNGRYVAFTSSANDLVKTDNNGHIDVFRLDRKTDTMVLVSRGRHGGANANAIEKTSISDDGRYVAFESDATNLVRHDTNAHRDVFIRDVAKGTTVRADRTTAGGQVAGGVLGRADMSTNGRYVAYESWDPNIVAGDGNGPDIFLFDRTTQVTTPVTQGQGSGHVGQSPSMSSSGSVICFSGPEGDVFAVHLTLSGHTPTPAPARFEVASVSSSGTAANAASGPCAMSRPGTKIAFGSSATNLVPNDTNGFIDVFVHTLGGGHTTRVSVNSGGHQGNSGSPAFGGVNRIDLSQTGNTVVFDSSASNLVSHDTNHAADVFARII